MNQIQLKAKRRDTGKTAAKLIRNAGRIPGIYYINQSVGKGKSDILTIPIEADRLSMRPIVYTSETKIIDLMLEGEVQPRECLLKEVKFDPVTDKIIHFDLLGINQDFKMTIEMPVALTGISIGVREGGLLQHIIHKVKIKCFPKNIPSSIELNISNLKIGKSLCIRDIVVDNVEFELAPETVVVSVVPPRVSKTAETK